MSQTTTTRRTAAERREEILEAALTEFAAHGFEGASTDAIARSAGLSQPYLFRLFGTKKELFLASVRRCFDDTHERFTAASAGLRGEEALRAMGRSYTEMISNDPRRLLAQLQAYAACDDPDVRDAVRAGYGRLVEHAESLGVPSEEVTGFFARGMLVNVLAAMGLPAADVAWGERLLVGCRSHD
jgi:AcrR family transcriptional regulator